MTDRFIDKIIQDKRVEVAETIGILKGIELAKKYSQYSQSMQIFQHLNQKNINELPLQHLEQDLSTVDSIICELGFQLSEYETLKKFLLEGIKNKYSE